MIRIKPNWSKYLQKLRDREFSFIFSRFNEKLFNYGLELGAGSGYQSVKLKKYVNFLISTELNRKRLKTEKIDKLLYMICDAELIDSYFRKEKFDIIFSSNLLEHLPNSKQALMKMHGILNNDGIMIHIMPNVFWKICHLLFHLPNIMIELLEQFQLKDIRKRIIQVFKKNKKELSELNNIKIKRKKKTILKNILIPTPHGISSSNFDEIYAFQKKKWITEFNKSGFEIIAILKAPVNSGYGFGLDFFRRILENYGFSSSNIFIVKKINEVSKYEHFFKVYG